MTTALLVWTLKASFVLLAALGATTLMRHASAAARHFVWTLALAGVLLLPALGLVLPALRVEGIPAVLSRSFAPEAPPSKNGPAGGIAGGPADPGIVGVRFDAERREAASLGAGSERYDLRPAGIGVDWLALAPLIWAAGAGIIVLRLAAGLVGLWILGRRAVMMTDARWLHAAHAIASRLGLGRGVTLLQGDRGTVPMTWGVLQPVVWLPADADAWDEERRTLVLTHELAHVRRRDALTQWIAHLALMVNWFNPLAWIAVKRFRDERERACDDAVLELGARPTSYANHLLEIVRTYRLSRGPAPALAMARHSQFEGRVLAILDGASPRRGLTLRSALPAGVLALAAVLPIAALSGERTGAHDLIARMPLASADSAAVAHEAGAPVAPSPGEARREPVAAPQQRSAARGAAAQGDSTLRLVIAAAASMSSDGDKADILRSVLVHPRLDAGDVVAVLEATHGMSSDGNRRDVLLAAIPRVDFAAARARRAFLASLAEFTSDGDRKDVLLATIVAVPARDAAIRRDLIRAVKPMTSDGDRADVLVALAGRTRLDPEGVRDLIESTGPMSSDGDKARVLVTVARSQTLDDAAQRAYLRQAEGMSSDGERRAALAALFPVGQARQGKAASATTARTEVVNGSRVWTTDLQYEGIKDGRESYSIAVAARNARVSPDGRRFAGLAPGGSLHIEETLFPGGDDSSVTSRTTRKLVLRAAGGGQAVREYRVNGSLREWDAEAEAWLDRFVARWAGGHSR